jgi:hypothetical protein
MFTSTDGVTFVYEREIFSWYCDLETIVYTAVLGFDTVGLSGTITIDHAGIECVSWNDNTEEYEYEDFKCTYIWNIFGTRR